MKHISLISLLLLTTLGLRAQWADCDTMVLNYVPSGVKFEVTVGFGDSAVVIPIINNTTTNFAYPQAKLANITPLPPGMSLFSTNWVVFASAWNVGDTAYARIGYNVTTTIPDNYTVKFRLSATNFAPLAIDSCIFSDTLTVNLKPTHPVAVGSSPVSGRELSCYPNPATSYIDVASTSANTMLDVYTTTGSLVLSAPIGRQTSRIDISILPAGIYILRQRGSNTTDKLVKTQ